nr:PREDICTED: putative disease resistance RPP13-like protein 1 isoform X2 [Musa acuminata subsp. malaccensis]
MGGGILSSMIKWTVEKLTIFATTPASSPAEPRNDVEEELRKLQRTMLRIQAKLDDSEEEDVRDESVRLWLSELKDVAYDAQDVVEESEYQVLRAEAESRSRGGGSHKGKHVEVCDYSISAPSRISFPDDLASKVKKIRERFDEITTEWKALRLGKKHGKRRRDESGNCRQTSSCFDESIVFGRDDEKEKLIGLLLSEIDDIGGRGGTMSLIPIIGMGGVGKTTLAQLVYNDPRVSNYFDTWGWVCVSEDFDVVGLTRKILVSFSKTTVYYTELNELQQELQKKLQGKKFLLVLDDVWNEKPSLWELVKVPLLKAGVGKVIVTTRNECVARIMQTMEPLNLNILPFDKCWMLFEKLALLEGLDSSSRHNDLVDIGRQIVEKCRGLPLAVKVIARALSYEDDRDKWMDILESELWESVDANFEIFPALKVSYDCLPVELKRCFQYLSLFPKDTVLSERYIVHLWMSQGLLRPPRSKRAEDIGSDYVSNLVERSILQIKRISIGHALDPEEEKELVMHDLVHDLAQSVAQGECLSIAANKLASIFQGDGDKFRKVRHLYLVFDDKMTSRDAEVLPELKRLRTLIIHAPHRERHNATKFLNESLRNFKYLRALELNYTNIEELPDSIGDLKLLRYLSIEGANIDSLPESICSHYNLQILNVTATFDLKELPSGIVNLPNIRHLMLNESGVAIPRGLGKLTNLQTLDCITLSPTRWRYEVEDLKGLVNLRGKLTVHNLRYVNEYVSQTDTPLKTKDRIESLGLNWSDSTNATRDMDDDTAKQVLECFRPHPNLKQLIICDYGGVRFATWLGDSSFSKLVNIEIVVCLKCNLLPPLGQLPSLRVLAIKHFSDLQRIGREFCGIGSLTKGFPSLETLTFSDMKNWKEWDGVVAGDFPRLRQLEIDNCPKLRASVFIISWLSRL